MTDEETRAAARLAGKRDERGRGHGKVGTRQQEIESARDDLAITLPLLMDRERARRDQKLRTAARVAGGWVRSGGGIADDLDGQERETFSLALREAASHDDRVNRFEAIADEKRATLRVAVTDEATTYGPGSPNSYYVDLARAAVPGLTQHREALERIERHSREVAYEVKIASRQGRRALGAASTRARRGGRDAREEQRAVTTGSTSAGAFVTPIWLQPRFGTYNSFPASFYEQSTQLPDPGYGNQMNLPVFDSPTSVAEQVAENSGVANSDPGGQLLTASMVTLAGEVDISQQLFDRGGPVGSDQIIYDQLHISLMTAIDSYVVAQALATAGTVAGASSFTAAALWQDLAEAKSQMATTAGTVLPATHMFLTPNVYEWAASESDPNGRPLLLPTPAGAASTITPGPDGSSPPGCTGERILATPVFTDGNIPTTDSGAETQMVLAHMPEVFVLATEPVDRAIPETFSADLSVVVQSYCLVGVIVRHPKAVQVVSGAAYPASPSFS